jgi:hypothetical protein
VDPVEEALQPPAGASNDPRTVLALQRSAGNRAVGRLLERGSPLSAAGVKSNVHVHTTGGWRKPV